jgi:NAD(P)-dependent dehydrogenase (short-subunit alcohol dehydrogenase family)
MTTFWRSSSTSPIPADAEASVAAAVDRFGRIAVLVNNAGNFNAGFFEELSPEEFRAQIETTFFGPVNVTRAALPIMRAQRSGLVVTISSTAGIEGGLFLTAYAASKFAVEGWMESLAFEIAPFGIRTMLVEPGFFRTELLTPESTKYAESSIADYADRTSDGAENRSQIITGPATRRVAPTKITSSDVISKMWAARTPRTAGPQGVRR